MDCAWLALPQELSTDPAAPPQDTIPFLPARVRLSIADLTLVPFGNMAFDTLPSPPPQTAVQPPSTRNASVIAGSPAGAALLAPGGPGGGLMARRGGRA